MTVPSPCAPALLPGRGARAIGVVAAVAVLAVAVGALWWRQGEPAEGAQWVGLLQHGLLVAMGVLLVAASGAVWLLRPLSEGTPAPALLVGTGCALAVACHGLQGLQWMAPNGGETLWGMAARLAEGATLALLAWHPAVRGSTARAAKPALWWGLAVVLGLGVWVALASQGGLAVALALLLSGVAVQLGQTVRRQPTTAAPGWLWVGAIAAFALAEWVAVLGAVPALAAAGPVLRALGYAALLRALWVVGLRDPVARAREAQQQLQQTHARLQHLGRNLPHSVPYQLVREPDGRRHFVYWGEALERLTGVAVGDALRDAQLFYGCIAEEDQPAVAHAEEESLRTMGPQELQVRLHRPDGRVCWIHTSSSPRALDGGRVIWDGELSDITEKRQLDANLHAHEAQLVEVLHRVPGGVSRLDRGLHILYVNEAQARWLQSTVAALQGRCLPDVLPPALMARMHPHLARAFDGHTVVFENRIDRPDGQTWCRHTTIVPEQVTEEGVRSVVLFAYDLTEFKRIEAELSMQKLRLSSLVNAIPDMVFLKNTESVYLSCNPVFERFAGRPEQAIVGLTDADLGSAADAARSRQYDLRAMQAWQPLVYEEELCFAEDGYQGHFETIKTPMRDAQGRVTGVLGVCRDITERKRAEQEIERLAFYDVLTGLPNRRLLLDRLGHACVASQRSGQLGALLFIDLDNFKDLNDTLGHDMGDQLLAQVAQRLSGAVRECDTVARFGGDEFVVVLQSLDSARCQAAAQAEAIAGKLLGALNAPYTLSGQPHYSTPSIGITLFGDERTSVDELLKRADMAMYQAKAAGRNTQRFFDPGMQAALHARSSLEADLRQGLARGEFFAHYQPVVDHHGRVHGCEALARWQHPERGLVSPAQFIPLAEQTGLILPLGEHILQLTCAQLARWAQRPQTAHLSIAVNVSARQFRQPGFVAQVLDTVHRSGANPQRLKLELTESLLLGDVEAAIERMVQLKAHGVGFSLDDFGTGYSSLSYLKRLPLDRIKIDQSFVRDLLSDPNDAAIVRTILALAQSLDLVVVAEGVETAGQLEFLRRHGCEEFQGYLFGRPVAIGVFEREHGLGAPEAGSALPAL